MKKLLTFILLLSALSVGCLFPTLGTFAMNSMDSGMHQSMGNDMLGGMDMPCCWEDDPIENDSASMHECCESPFLDSIAYNGNSTLADPDEADDSDNADWKVLCALHESLINNNIHKLNSPPRYAELLYDAPNNTYIRLVGIIKNNS